jgi:lipoprotein-anchoring transpeptidase ErfK/SrfK
MRRQWVPWIAAAILCLVSAHVPAQSLFQYPVTAPDVDPGIDHGNSDANLPDEFRKQMVLYRSM